MGRQDQLTAAVVAAMSPPRLASYLTKCAFDERAALNLYSWNSDASAAFWVTLGYLEIALRNTLAGRLRVRHLDKDRPGTWLDDPAGELAARAREDIAAARRRVRAKGKQATEGQLIAELPFGFWRFLAARQYQTTLWPDLASGFPHAPTRARRGIETPVAHLHDLRNRLAHHEPIWNKPLEERRKEIYTVVSAINPQLCRWVADRCRIRAVLEQCPVSRPHP